MRNCMDHWEEHRLRPILEEYVKKIVFEKLVESWKPYMAGIRWLYGAILASAAIAVLNLIFGIVKTP